MRVSIVAVGSRGDVQPYVALGKGLVRAGHAVRIATHANFEAFVGAHGLDFAPIEGNPQALLESENGQKIMKAGRNPLVFFRELKRMAEPIMQKFLADCQAACADAKAVVFSILGWPGYHIAEQKKIPCFFAPLQPLIRTRAFPYITMPGPKRLGGAYNLLTHIAAERIVWFPLRGMVNAWRMKRLGLPPLSGHDPFERIERQRLPALCGFSPTVVPPPADWGDWIHVTGFWFLPADPHWQPDPALADFLAAGPAPVYVGFGSMNNRDSAAVTAQILNALADTGNRAILMSGWGGLSTSIESHDVCMVDNVPHDWLFPRMAAVVHHGGAGTTAAGLRAGVPSVVSPFFGDQFFWAQRVRSLGVGPWPIPHKQLNAKRLTDALHAVSVDGAMRSRAADVGARIRAEGWRPVRRRYVRAPVADK